MTISHHSHSGEFCSHAKGTLEKVVQTAIMKGFTTFGLSEHIPRYRIEDLYPEEKALGVTHLSTTFDLYVEEAHRLKVLHAGDLDLIVGLETELIHDEGLNQLKSLLNQYGERIEYIVGSLHHCCGQPIDYDKGLFDTCLESFPIASTSTSTSTSSSSLPPPPPSPPSSTSTTTTTTTSLTPIQQSQFTSLFIAYFEAQYTLLTTLQPEIIGHIDLCRLYYPTINFEIFPSVWKKLIRNIKYVVGYGGLFEVNAAAFRKGWNCAFPGREVFKLIQSLSGQFTLSDDSHGPNFVALNYSKLYSYLIEMEVKELWFLISKSNLGLEGRIEGEWSSRGVVKRKIVGRPWEEGGSWSRRLAVEDLEGVGLS